MGLTPARDVTVTTATMPGREQFLAECVESVKNQTSGVYAHVIRCRRPDVQGPVALVEQRNALLGSVTTAWLAVIDDDDLWCPNHLATLAPHLDTADVIYSWTTNRRAGETDVTGWPNRELSDRLRQGNLICSNSLIRTSAVRAVGGWGGPFDGDHFTLTGAGWEDWDLWIRLADNKARFVCVPEYTWTYRAHDQQSTRVWGMR